MEQDSDKIQIGVDIDKMFEITEDQVITDTGKKKKKGKESDIDFSKVEINERFQQFLDCAETGKHIFLTGDAGTGKSVVAKYFINKCQKEKLNVAVLAPTGLAAVNIGGQTIHSFFKLKPKPMTIHELRKLDPEKVAVMKSLDTIIIDEVSMVRSDMMDIIDHSLRINRGKDKPFGGVQMILIGDLNQLPPVVASQADREIIDRYDSPFFFSADVISQVVLHKIRLNKAYRQSDKAFLDILDNLKKDCVTQEQYDMLNQRQLDYPVENEGTITLCTTNQRADFKNTKRLENIESEAKTYTSIKIGRSPSVKSYIPDELTLKVGAQVMFLVNDRLDRYKNGTTGVVTKLEDSLVTVVVKGKKIEVERHEWESINYSLNKGTDRVDQSVTGSVKQFPLRLAWAISIHKSQGQTYDDVIIDLGSGTFASGQAYVAVSRCRTLEGIQLQNKISPSDIINDVRVKNYLADLT